MPEITFRTDRNNNPAAFTADVAEAGGLELDVDYVEGDPFKADGKTYYTARLLGDPIELTIRVIDAATYYTRSGKSRWNYSTKNIAIPTFTWKSMTYEQKRDVIGFHYANEGGVALRHLFPNYGEK